MGTKFAPHNPWFGPLKIMLAERRRGPASDEIVSVRLTRKHAESLDGVDLSGFNVGDRLELAFREATLLIAEGWAVPWAQRENAAGQQATHAPRMTTADRFRPSSTAIGPAGSSCQLSTTSMLGPLSPSIQQPADEPED